MATRECLSSAARYQSMSESSVRSVKPTGSQHLPLPAKGAVAPMPSRTAGLFASRGAGRAAGAACVRKG